VGNTAFFTASTPAEGQEVWKTDGTEAGTIMVRDIVPGVAGSSPRGFVAIGNNVFFTASSGVGTASCCGY